MSISLCSPRPSATSRHWVQVRIRVCRRRWPSNQHGAHDPARPRRPRQPCGVGLRVRHPSSARSVRMHRTIWSAVGSARGVVTVAWRKIAVGHPGVAAALITGAPGCSVDQPPRSTVVRGQRPRRPGGRSPPRRSHSLVDARRPLLGRRLRVGGSGLLRRNIDERRRVCRLLPRMPRLRSRDASRLTRRGALRPPACGR